MRPSSLLVLLVTALGQRVVSQRRLIAQHATWSNDSRTSDVTTAPDDSPRYLCGGSYPRVRPDDRTFNARTFLDETAMAQYRVDDLRAGFDLTIVANHR